MNITHSCGHQVPYKAVKDKKVLAACPCPACEYAARATPPAPATVYCTPTFYESGRSIACVSKGGVEGWFGLNVVEFSLARSPGGYRSFATRQEAIEHLREQVRLGHIEIRESEETREQAEERARSMAIMSQLDAAEAGAVARRTSSGLGDWSPDDEDADEALFGKH